ncbi:fimbrial protein [Serratia fonticola]|nr:fimbrial protein [Serratia fonticola]CAI2004825.1 fimbrial protein [Serratia fonticola]CAI2008503.1 fimbrial protein [Serratia fonticola]CAI2017287.1 fimbrial protein [Serratia fonticola]
MYLGSVNSAGLGGAGAASSSTKFGVTLTSCPAAVKGASVKFDGPTDVANSSLLALTAGDSGSKQAVVTRVSAYASPDNNNGTTHDPE